MTRLLINLALAVTVYPVLAVGFAFEHAVHAFQVGRDLYYEFAKARLKAEYRREFDRYAAGVMSANDARRMFGEDGGRPRIYRP